MYSGGYNEEGQLGDGTLFHDQAWNNPSLSPTRQIMILGGTGVVSEKVLDELRQKLPIFVYDYSLVE